MKTNVMTHRTSALLLAAGVLCLCSVSSALASEYGNDPNPSERSSTKPLAGDMETINAENRPAVDQDKEISLKTTAETPMSSSELSTSTRESPETLSQYMLDLVEHQNEQAALGF
jgi:hypothetical protein